MKAYNIVSSILAVVGLIFLYVGYYMAQGRFWGVAYAPGDYSTLFIGLVFIMGSIVLFIIPRLSTRTETETTINESISHYRHKNGYSNIYLLLRVIAFISLVVCIFLIIASFSNNDGIFFVYGIGCFINYVFMYGFSYIVEAACLYIEKRKQEIYEEQIKQTDVQEG